MEVKFGSSTRQRQHLLLHPARAASTFPQTEPEAIQLSQGILPDLVVLDLVLTDCNAVPQWIGSWLFEAGERMATITAKRILLIDRTIWAGSALPGNHSQLQEVCDSLFRLLAGQDAILDMT